MLLQFVTVLQGVLAPALLVMALSVMLTVGEGRDKPLSAYWRLAGFVVGFAGAVVFAALRATAVITQRTFVNYPTLWCCVILDVAVFVIVLFARRITTYVAVCAFLTFVNWYTSPHYWWVLWVIAGWGLNIALSLTWYLFDCDDECNYRNR